MAVRRLVARTPLAALDPVFAAIRAREGVREDYADAVLAEASVGTQEDPEHVVGERHHLTDVPFVTIDPVGSRDLDQALHLARHDGGWRLRYAIADVAAHVSPGGALDADTRARGETVYCPDTRVGLHPPVMSEGFASLLPGQRTKAVVWEIDIDATGHLARVDVARAWVRSTRQFSYPEVSAPADDATRELARTLREVGDVRRAAMRERGAVTLPKPSQEVVASGGELTLEFRAATAVEDDNAQLSLLAGEAAAALQIEAGVGILRTMPPADEESVARLRRQARAIGIDWPREWSYGDVLATVDPASAAGAAFLVHAVTLFRGAQWEAFDVRPDAPVTMPLPQQASHGALGAPYAHVTAPLRRLADRFATEVCVAHAAGVPVPGWVTEALPTVPDAQVGGARRGAAVDRACVNAVEAALLGPHVGESFVAVGLDERTVQLTRPAVVGRCGGEIPVGEDVEVSLVSASAENGPRFEVLRRLPSAVPHA